MPQAKALITVVVLASETLAYFETTRLCILEGFILSTDQELIPVGCKRP
jgi:hypothetical protein